MNPLSSKDHFLAQTRQTKRRTNRTENHHEQTTKSDFGARVSRMRRRFSALPLYALSPSQPFFGMSRNAPPKETAAHIRTTFLSIVWPITAFVPFSRTQSRQIRPLRLVQSEIIFYFRTTRWESHKSTWRHRRGLKKLSI